jgi:crystallin alpha B
MSLVPISLRDPFWSDPYFSSAREEFDTMRRQMMKEAKEFWSKVDDDPFPNIRSERNTELANLSPAAGLPRWIFPHHDTATSPSAGSWPLASERPGSLLSSSDNQVIKLKEDDTKLEVTLDCTGYRPEELKVTTLPDNCILIEGKHEEKSDGGNNRSMSSQQFSRKYTLPQGCDPMQVVSNLSRDGVLMVTAPKKVSLGSSERPIPILQR